MTDARIDGDRRVTIYAHRRDAPSDEATGTLGGVAHDTRDSCRFSIEEATASERAADETATPETST